VDPFVTALFGVGIAVIQGLGAWSLLEVYKMRQELTEAHAQIRELRFMIELMRESGNQ